MSELATNIIKLLIGVALFIAGMGIMSGGLKKATGRSLKRLFNKTQNSRFAGLGIGAGVTALIQSSGATSVMTIGFINAGVMTIFQGVCIILGAYLGTTVTGLLVSFSSFGGVSLCLCLLALVGVILDFFKKEIVKSIGQILTGLGILFVGLEMMKGAFASGPLLDAFTNLFQSVNSPILLLLIGALFTCLTQSSSATSGIVIVMVGQGAIPLESGFYLVLGATIGTVLVTIVASIGGEVDAKRTAFLCLLIRIVTALLALAILWPVEACCNNAISAGLCKMLGNNLQFTVAVFLIIYNVIFVGFVLPFIKPLVEFSKVCIKDHKLESKKKVLKFIDNKLLINPAVALGQTKNEIINMLELAKINFALGYHIIIEQDFSKSNELEEREEAIDFINNEITNFLIELSQGASHNDEKKIGSYFHIINDIERIGDHAYNFYESAKKMHDSDLKFSDHAKEEIKKIYFLIDEMFELAEQIFKKPDINKVKKLHSLEDETDVLKTSLSEAHYQRIRENKCNMELSPFYTTLVSEFERVADHLVNIGYAYLNPTGDDQHINF